jgi:NADPH:quinone reductase-like Zn-dependent oxidoreductase
MYGNLTPYDRFRQWKVMTMTIHETDADGVPTEVAAPAPRTPDATPTPSSMRAIVQDRYGSPDVLELRDLPVPTPTEDQVLIRVVASSLNIYDVHMTTGKPYMARMVAGLTTPKHPVPGADVAGVIEQVGANVTQWKPGDEVFGDIGMGAFAEYATARPTAIAAKPANISFTDAAAVPLAALTALQGLRDVGGLVAGQKVLVNGASGGVGTFAVQIAKALGAEVTAVCSTGKVEMVASIGADRVVDYTKDDFTTTERGYDLVFDNVGDRSWPSTSRVLAPSGITVAVTGPKHALMGPMRNFVVRKVMSMPGGKRMTWFTAHVDQEDLEFLAGLLESGAIRPVIEATHPLERVPEALAYLSRGHALGKLAITVADRPT